MPYNLASYLSSQRLAGPKNKGQQHHDTVAPTPKGIYTSPNDKNPNTTIAGLLNRGLDKKQIVGKLTGTKPGSGAADQLNRGQLQAIGFSNNFINDVKPQPKPYQPDDWSSWLKNPSVGDFSSLVPKGATPGTGVVPPAAAPAAPKPPTLEEYLAGDTTYNGQTSMFEKALNDYKVSNGAQQRNVETDFKTMLDRLGNTREKSLDNIEADYAGRGMLYSGLYGDSVGDYNKDYQNSVSDLTTDKERTLQDLLDSLRQFQDDITGKEMSAKQEAVNRRAQELALLPVATDPSGSGSPVSIPSGETPTIVPSAPSAPSTSDRPKGGIYTSPNDTNPNTTIAALLKKGLDKKQIVARLTGTKPGSDAAGELNRGQLQAIGFSNNFINNVKKKR